MVPVKGKRGKGKRGKKRMVSLPPVRPIPGMPVFDYIPEPKRPVGRPATGRDPVVAVRLPKATLEMVDRWRRNLSRSDAIRRLIDDGLSTACAFIFAFMRSAM
jgi:hypothetical protein